MEHFVRHAAETSTDRVTAVGGECDHSKTLAPGESHDVRHRVADVRLIAALDAERLEPARQRGQVRAGALHPALCVRPGDLSTPRDERRRVLVAGSVTLVRSVVQRRDLTFSQV